MERKIKTLYVIHHSHTDIGYTDLQERVIDTQADYIHTVLKMMKQPKYQDFRWNCEDGKNTAMKKKERSKICKSGGYGLMNW